MSTPRWFQMSATVQSPAQLLKGTLALRTAHRFRPRDITGLGWNAEEARFTLRDETEQPVRDDAEALEIARAWPGFFISYDVLSIRADIYLGFWEMHGTTCMALETDTQAPYVKPNGMAEGEWLERFLCDYVATCGVAACAHGWNWPVAYEPLEPARLLSGLRDGTLLTRSYPNFYMLSEQLLSGHELSSLLQEHQPHRLLRYFRTPSGYHVLSSLSRRNWWEA